MSTTEELSQNRALLGYLVVSCNIAASSPGGIFRNSLQSGVESDKLEFIYIQILKSTLNEFWFTSDSITGSPSKQWFDCAQLLSLGIEPYQLDPTWIQFPRHSQNSDKQFPR